MKLCPECDRPLIGHGTRCRACYDATRPRTMPRGVCRHCQRHMPLRSRGLCTRCTRTPGVAQRYSLPLRGQRGICRGVPDFNGHAPLPPAPTRALPGTPEKVETLRERCRLHQALWHPQDATLEEAPNRYVALAEVEPVW